MQGEIPPRCKREHGHCIRTEYAGDGLFAIFVENNGAVPSFKYLDKMKAIKVTSKNDNFATSSF